MNSSLKNKITSLFKRKQLDKSSTMWKEFLNLPARAILQRSNQTGRQKFEPSKNPRSEAKEKQQEKEIQEWIATGKIKVTEYRPAHWWNYLYFYWQKLEWQFIKKYRWFSSALAFNLGAWLGATFSARGLFAEPSILCPLIGVSIGLLVLGYTVDRAKLRKEDRMKRR